MDIVFNINTFLEDYAKNVDAYDHIVRNFVFSFAIGTFIVIVPIFGIVYFTYKILSTSPNKDKKKKEEKLNV